MIDPKLRRCVVDLRDEVFMLQRLFFDEIAQRGAEYEQRAASRGSTPSSLTGRAE